MKKQKSSNLKYIADNLTQQQEILRYFRNKRIKK